MKIVLWLIVKMELFVLHILIRVSGLFSYICIIVCTLAV